MRGIIPPTHYQPHTIFQLLHSVLHHRLIHDLNCPFVSVSREALPVELHRDQIFISVLIYNYQSLVFLSDENENLLLSIVVHPNHYPRFLVLLDKPVDLFEGLCLWGEVPFWVAERVVHPQLIDLKAALLKAAVHQVGGVEVVVFLEDVLVESTVSGVEVPSEVALEENHDSSGAVIGIKKSYGDIDSFSEGDLGGLVER